MNNPLILVGSTTNAMRGRDLLNSRGFRAYIERVKRSRATGCGYGIYVAERADEAERILRAEGFRILGRIERGGRL